MKASLKTVLLPAFCVSLAAVLAALVLLTRRQARRAERAYPPAGRFVAVNGLRLHYVRRGQMGAQTVVLLHGSEGFWQDFEAVIAPLAERYDVIAFDRPGHGYSDAPNLRDCPPDAQADILHQALCRLGVQKPLLVGHSWSGALLLAYAVKYPGDAAGLTLLAGWVYAPDTHAPWVFRVPDVPLIGPLCAATLLPLVKPHFLRKSLVEAFAPDPVPADYARAAEALWQRRSQQARAFARENSADRPAMRAYAPAYGEIQVPVVIVAGEQDMIVPPAAHALRLHAALPSSELILLPDTGHELPQTRPDAVCAAIARCHRLAEAAQAKAAQSASASVGANARDASADAAPVVPASPDTGLPDSGDSPCADPASSALPDCLRARSLVMRYGWNAMSYQLLNPDMTHWFAADGEAVVGYVRRHGVRVAAGAPVCRADKLAGVVAEFERDAARAGETVCYFGAAARLQSLLAQIPGHDQIVLGAQPAWTPARWPAILQKNSSLRAQMSRARNKGATVEEWTPERAHNAPALQRCLDEWMATHPFPPLHFLTEAVTLDRLQDRRLFVAVLSDKTISPGKTDPKTARSEGGGAAGGRTANNRKEPNEKAKKEPEGEVKANSRQEQNSNGKANNNRAEGGREEEGQPVGFLIATPIPERRGWLVEQIVRGRNAPNGTAELLVDAMMRAFDAENFDYVTLGLAPLTRRAEMPADAQAASRAWLRLLLRWVRTHGQRFYNFEGLDAFKAKFRPDVWEPLYAISNEARFSTRALYAVAAAFSDGPPPAALARALFGALKQELVWFRARLHE